MREFIGNAHNEQLLINDDGTLTPAAEIVLMLSEPVYDHSPGRGFTSRRKTTEVRFGACAARLRNLGRALVEIADSLDRHAANYGRVDGAGGIPLLCASQAMLELVPALIEDDDPRAVALATVIAAAGGDDRGLSLCPPGGTLALTVFGLDGQETPLALDHLRHALSTDGVRIDDVREELASLGECVIENDAGPMFRISVKGPVA